MAGIKETSELLDGIKLLAVSGKKIAKDGISVSDLSEVIELVKHFDVLAGAVAGLGDLDDEIKNLDQAEIIALVAKVYEVVQAFKAA